MYSTKSEYYDLPIKYNETILRLLVQSPTRMYAYWEVSSDSITRFTRKKLDYNNCSPLLIITNLTKNYSYEIPIDPFANNYYIEVEDTNCNYQVTLARKYNNNYIDIYVSNEVTVPRSTPCTYENEVTFRNYICLGNYKKIKIHTPKYGIVQNIDGLEFSTDNIISSNMHIK